MSLRQQREEIEEHLERWTAALCTSEGVFLLALNVHWFMRNRRVRRHS